MKLTRTLQITENEFYDYLEQQLIEAVQQCSQLQISTEQIKKGFGYIQDKENRNTKKEITILEYERGKHYKSSVTSINDTILLAYSTKTVEKGLQVTLEQHIQSFETTKHNFFMQKFSECVYFGRMSDAIYKIQDSIIKTREAH